MVVVGESWHLKDFHTPSPRSPQHVAGGRYNGVHCGEDKLSLGGASQSESVAVV